MFIMYSLTHASCLVVIHFLGGPSSFCVAMKDVCMLTSNNGSCMCVGLYVGGLMCMSPPKSFSSEILKRIYDRKTDHVQIVIVPIFDSYFKCSMYSLVRNLELPNSDFALF
jgi:hypothetical protein